MPIDVAVLANELDQLFRQKHATQDVERLLTRALATARAGGEATGRAEEREAHAEVVSALDELATIIDESVADRDFLDLDSFTTQPARRALAAIRAREGA